MAGRFAEEVPADAEPGDAAQEDYAEHGDDEGAGCACRLLRDAQGVNQLYHREVSEVNVVGYVVAVAPFSPTPNE